MHGGMSMRGAGRSFAEAVAALLAALGAAAEAGEPISAPFHLSIDELGVTLDETDDERALRVTVSVGALAADPVRRQDQLRRILKRNLALIRDQRFVAVLDEADDQQLVLQLQFAEPYAEILPAALAGRLGELVSMAEFYGELLATGARRARPATTTAAEETLIFRP